jgi:mRNA turnover protein 4
VRTAVDDHDRVYVFSYENMRSNHFQEIRLHFRSRGSNSTSTASSNSNHISRATKDDMHDDDDDDDDENDDEDHEQDPAADDIHDTVSDHDSSRIFLGKNKFIQIALGRTTQDEYCDNLRHISQLITGGSVGLLCTNRTDTDVESYFAQLEKTDYARAGATSNRDVIITNADLKSLPISMIEQLRKLGLPVDIQNGVIFLRETSKGCNAGEYRICKEGNVLTAEQCKLLVHFNCKVSNFRVHLVGRWIKDTCEFTKL